MLGYTISTKQADFDLNLIHGFLSRSYWAKDIPLPVLEKAIRNSLCFAVLTASGSQAGFARMITDRATFAYLADVFIVPGHRGKGLATWLISTIHAHPELQGLRRYMLTTRDAHGLYRRFGYLAPGAPQHLMEITRPDIYQQQQQQQQ